MLSSTKNIFLFFLLAIYINVRGQELDTISQTFVDDKYREDQFYFAITFNLLTEKPSTIEQNGFSGGLQLGFIRDMPINQRRNLALGIGAGISLNTYSQNLLITQDSNGDNTFETIPSNIDFDSNRFTTYGIDLPIQIRWRTSTPTDYKFWRIYTGVNLSYLYSYKFNYKDSKANISYTEIKELDDLRTAITFSFGYSTFNIYLYYELNPLFEKGITVDNQELGLKPLRIGLIFYIL